MSRAICLVTATSSLVLWSILAMLALLVLLLFSKACSLNLRCRAARSFSSRRLCFHISQYRRMVDESSDPPESIDTSAGEMSASSSNNMSSLSSSFMMTSLSVTPLLPPLHGPMSIPGGVKSINMTSSRQRHAAEAVVASGAAGLNTDE